MEGTYFHLEEAAQCREAEGHTRSYVQCHLLITSCEKADQGLN